jgi:hypothetical protein
VTSVQYRIVVGKKDEIVEGNDDAELVVSIAVEALRADPALSFMQGKLKSTGSTGALLALMSSGEMATALERLADR